MMVEVKPMNCVEKEGVWIPASRLTIFHCNIVKSALMLFKSAFYQTQIHIFPKQYDNKT